MDRIHIKPIRAEHHSKVGSEMGSTYKGHKLHEHRLHTGKFHEEELE